MLYGLKALVDFMMAVFLITKLSGNKNVIVNLSDRGLASSGQLWGFFFCDNFRSFAFD